MGNIEHRTPNIQHRIKSGAEARAVQTLARLPGVLEFREAFGVQSVYRRFKLQSVVCDLSYGQTALAAVICPDPTRNLQMVNTIPVRLICHPHMKVLLFSIFATVVLIGCAPAAPIDRAVKAESSKPAPRGMAYLVTSAPATALPAEIATKVLSGPGWNESPTNVVILESRQVSISHKDDKELLTPAMKQWIAVLADTKFGEKIVFLQCHEDHKDSRAFWTYYIRDN